MPHATNQDPATARCHLFILPRTDEASFPLISRQGTTATQAIGMQIHSTGITSHTTNFRGNNPCAVVRATAAYSLVRGAATATSDVYSALRNQSVENKIKEKIDKK